MTICGPNCFGALNVKTGSAAYSGKLPKPLRKGSVALVSQSGGLGANVFTPLMSERQLGFSHVISCGNQIGASIEDYIEYLVQDPDVRVVAAIIESLRKPNKLLKISQMAHARNKSLLFFQAGRSAVGQVMTQSHTGALAGDAEILDAHLRRCGIVRAETYDEFVEAIELFAIAPSDQVIGRDVIIVSGSGGGAAVAADSLDGSGMVLPDLAPETCERIAATLPDFGSVTNPIDGTGAMSDDPKLLPKLYEAILADESRAILATSVSAWPAGKLEQPALRYNFGGCRAFGETHGRRLSAQSSRRSVGWSNRRDAAFGRCTAAARHHQQHESAEIFTTTHRLSREVAKSSRIRYYSRRRGGAAISNGLDLPGDTSQARGGWDCYR